MKSQILSFLILVSSANCMVFRRQGEGPCPNVTTVDALNLADYLGPWFQPSGIPWGISPEGTRCISAEYADNGDGTVSVFNQQYNPGNEYDDACGRACVPDPENRPGEFYVTFGPTGDNFCQFDDPTQAPSNYKILGVNTEAYSSVYSCSGADRSNEIAWLLTRDPIPSQATIDEALSHFEANGIDLTKFVEYPSGPIGGCTYEPPEGETACIDQ